MDQNTLFFARRYRLYLRLMAFLERIAPQSLHPFIIRTVGRWANPFQLRAANINKALLSRFSPEIARAAWLNWLDSHSLFTLNFLAYDHLDNDWLAQRIDIENPDLLEALRISGGLLLTYHTHHQNTLCCALGFAGCEVSAIAAAPEDSPLFPYIGRWAQKVNASSEQHFRGGRYFFINNKRLLARSIRQQLQEKKVLVSLCDFHQPALSSVEGKILGRIICPPVGAIEMAIKLKAPIYAAILAPQNGCLKLQIRQLNGNDGVSAIVQGYLDFLESRVLNNPCCWQGWDWLNELAELEKISNDQ